MQDGLIQLVVISQKNYRNIKVQKFVEDFSSFSRGEAVYKVHFGISDHLYSVIGEKIGVTGQCESGTVQIGFRRSEEHTSELQSRGHLVCRLLLEKKQLVALTRQSSGIC